ncbi:MAG: hypothetical protein GOMPHAMPRED_001932 [Gomphillus americanus]|uniref:Uncharacterized protein n=1 Tax=Gomphillus americanus TaxID=1940652 RepID=A0A8H3F868_9LECA|nr:MAG: hypothetical protein GOMPHAMPRED_001932 [Gomphillus americanus]
MNQHGDRCQLATTFETEQLLSEKQQTDSTERDEIPAEIQQFWLESKQRSSHARLIYHAVIHLLLIASVLYVGTSHFWTSRTLKPYAYSPAANIVEFFDSDEDPVTHGHRSIYYGEPTTENIAAWDDLVDPTFMAVTKEELVRSGGSPERAVRLADYDGQFVAGTGVYHNLHCLRRLRWWVYQDYFYSNRSAVNLDVVLPHLGM